MGRPLMDALWLRKPSTAPLNSDTPLSGQQLILVCYLYFLPKHSNCNDSCYLGRSAVVTALTFQQN